MNPSNHSRLPKKLTEKNMPTKDFIYSHTHWDREWYLSQTQFQCRLIRTMDEIIELIEADDGFDVFVMDGQTCIIQDYLDLRPERAVKVRELIAAGKLAIGPWYSMPDDFLAGGEALIRNLMRGHADCRDYGAGYPNVGYVPDSFGHIEQMPQLLRGVGIDNFVFGRGRPVALAVEDGHRLEFLWQAPDGTSVFAWHLAQGYAGAMFLPGVDRSEKLRERFEKIIEAHANSHRPELVLAAHGIDHTWLQRDIAAILRKLPELLPEVEFHHGTLEDALDEWRREMPTGLETWEGQLRGRLSVGELHGTLSSRIDNKVWNERARMYVENLAEPLDAIAWRYGKASARPYLRRAWELMLQNHAHDSICGCSQDRVHDEVNARFLKAAELGTDVADRALDLLNFEARRNSAPAAVVYAGLNAGNPVVDFVLRLPAPPEGTLCLSDAEGGRYRVQLDVVEKLRIRHTDATVDCYEARGCVYVPDLVFGEVRRLTVTTGFTRKPEQPVRCRGRALENGILRVEVRPDGSLDLTHLRSGRVIAGTHYFVQETDLGGGYHFQPLPNGSRRDTRGGKARVRRVTKGPLRGSLEVRTRLAVPAGYNRERQELSGRGQLVMTSTLTLEAGSELLKIRTVIENGAGNQRLRVVLPTGMQTTEVYADASFAVHANSLERWPAEANQNFHPMRSFVDIAEDHGGLAFIGKGLHEYEIVPGAEGTALEITLLRSVDFIFLCSTWETPGAQLRGSLTHEYALRLHAGDWRTAGVAESAAAFLNPAIAHVSGDTLHPNEEHEHATIGFYAMRNDVAVPIDTNRSPWHVTNAHRDGWRRMEPDRFPDTAMPGRIVPFGLDGEHLLVSAFKRAEDGNGEILRFWSAAAAPQIVRIRGGCPGARLQQTDLLERNLPETAAATDELTLDVRPFEIVTIRIALTARQTTGLVGQTEKCL